MYRFWKWTALIGALYFGITTLLSVPAVSAFLVGRLEVFPALTAAEIEAASNTPASAIVILSAGQRDDAPEFGSTTVDEIALERLRYGAELARRTDLPILVSGGGDAQHPTHAKIMADVLLHDYGITAKWQETSSTNTAENAIYSSEILKKTGINRILLVTHAWHMKRARAAFAANGMIVIPAPTAFYGRPTETASYGLIPSFHALRMSGYAIHETVGALWYSVRYGY
jgi:uncharacterized SAM-binding protein YcdF (DUF218 family)